MNGEISVLYTHFTHALSGILSENAAEPVRRGPLARAHAALKRHPDYDEHAFCLAVETAFAQWEAFQNSARA